MVANKPPHGRCGRRILLLTLLLVAAATGCQQRVYRATSLPPELASRGVPTLRAVDLAQLGGQSLNSEQIYVGDVLEVQLATGVEREPPRNWQLRVREDGTLNVPLVGPVPVASMDLQAAENAIRFASVERQVFRQPAVGLAVSQRRVNRITVTGGVAEPSTYAIPVASSTLMTALLSAGGLSETADRYVEVRQPQRPADLSGGPRLAMNPPHHGPQLPPGSLPQPGREQGMRVDLLSAVAHGGGDIYLQDGAVVTVTEQPPRFVHVIGLVRQQKRVEVPPGENLRLLDALALAGGTSMSPVIADKVQIVRKRPGSDETVVIKGSIREAKKRADANLMLAADDILSVEETPITFTLGTMQGLMGIGVLAAGQLR